MKLNSTLTYEFTFLFAVMICVALSPTDARAQYIFGTLYQSTNTAVLSYNSANNSFQYTDSANASDDGARLPLIGAVTNQITTTNNWAASLTANIAARSMTASYSASPHIWLQLAFYYKSASGTELVTMSLQQENNTGSYNAENFPDGYYGTAASLHARTNGNADVTVPLGASIAVQGDSVLLLSPNYAAAPATESLPAVSGTISLNYNAALNTVTGYYNGTPVGSYSLTGWGDNPPLTLGVAADSGEGVLVPSGTATASNFFAGMLPQLLTGRSGNNLILKWPTNAAGFKLRSTTNLSSAVWITNQISPIIISGQNNVTNPISDAQQFFRLSQ